MKSISLIIALCLPFILFSQNNISGTIKNKSNNESIPYVNIGVVGVSIGTVSDENGCFTLDIPDQYLDTELRISSIGYKMLAYSTARLFIETYNNGGVIKLEEEAQQLPEVVVNIKKQKKKKKQKDKYAIGFEDAKLGRELGVLKNAKEKSYIDFIEFFIAVNENKKSKLRLNLYSVDENGNPKEKINKSNIYVEIGEEEVGLVFIDLSSHKIEVEGDYIISFECISEMNKLMFSADIKGETYFRPISLDQWKSIIPEMKCDVLYK